MKTFMNSMKKPLTVFMMCLTATAMVTALPINDAYAGCKDGKCKRCAHRGKNAKKCKCKNCNHGAKTDNAPTIEEKSGDSHQAE